MLLSTIPATAAALLGSLSCVSALAVGFGPAKVEERGLPLSTCQGEAGSLANILAVYEPALSYCSSAYPPASSTLTSTDYAASSTVTSTDSTEVLTSAVSTDTSTITASTLTEYSTTVISSKTTVLTIMTVPSEVKVTTTATRTVSATVQSYIRRDVTASPNNKIVKKRGASKCKPQSPEESALSVIEADAALASSVCGCIELPAGPATVIVTKTPVATDLITTTTTEDVTASTKVTTSPTVTVVVSSTDINVISESSTATSLEFTTATVSTTTTTTAVQQSPVPYCQPGTDYDTPNAGGCFSQTGGVICYCDSDPSGNAVCDTSPACGVACNTDADCADTEFCANGYYADCNSVGRSCISFLGCSSTYVKVAGRDWAAPGGIVARNVSGRPPLQPYPGTELVNHNAE